MYFINKMNDVEHTFVSYERWIEVDTNLADTISEVKIKSELE